jgi:outer membrane usher protein
MKGMPNKAVYCTLGPGHVPTKESHQACRFSLSMMTLGLAMPTAQVLAAPVAADTPPATPTDETTVAYTFDSRLLLGSSLGVIDIERYNKASVIDPGRYQVDIYLNDHFVTRKAVEFRGAENSDTYPCLSDEFLRSSGVLISDMQSGSDDSGAAPVEDHPPETQDSATTPIETHASSAACMPLAQRVEGAAARFDLSRLRLDLSVPQAMMKNRCDPDRLRAGGLPLLDPGLPGFRAHG